jgi:micrococcal nuclease
MFEYFCKVTRVVDGDTIDVNIDLGFQIWHKARVRMLGIDTPESRTRNLEEKAMGLASKARLKELLKGQNVKISCSKEKGKFGRVLATVITVAKDGTEMDCNTQLIEEGHARTYFGGKKIPWT